MNLIKEIRDVLDQKGYEWFTLDKSLNINLIGVRDEDHHSNKFNDMFYMIYRKAGENHIIPAQGTTDPGKYWLEHPMNSDGTFIMKPSQYKGLWRLGKHRGEYEAFVQNAPVTGYRDNNKDDVLDMRPETLVRGMYGINMHRSNPYTESYYVDKWSAGCQVHKKLETFDKYIDIAKLSVPLYGNSFSYTLLTEEDFS